MVVLNTQKSVYAVALNPKTGAVLAMSGIKHNLETGDLTPDSLGTVTNVFVPGSVVKAATISSGWENGVLSGNQAPMNANRLQRFCPYQFLSIPYCSFLRLQPLRLLEYSSNATWFKLR